MQLTSLSLALTRAGFLSFSPASLFANGEVGAWYDPSDFDRYTSSLGPELVTNGDFSDGTTGWTATAASLSASGGVIRVTNTATGTGLAFQSFSTVAGRTYKCSARFVAESGANMDFRVGTAEAGTTLFRDAATNSGTVTGYFTAATATTFVTLVAFNSSGAIGSYVEFDNISVRELTAIDTATLFQDSAGTTPVTAVEQPVGLMLDKSKGLVLGPELVTNGTFDTNINGWVAGISPGLSTFSWDAGRLKGAYFSGGASFAQAETTVVGKWYAVTGTITAGSGSAGVYIQNSQSSFGPYLLTLSAAAGETKTVSGYFLATATTTWVHCYAGNTAGNVTFFDNISVRELPGNHATQSTSASRPVLSARVNLLTKTEQFDDAVWAKDNVNVSPNTTATTDPLGGNTADKLIASSTNTLHVTTGSAIPAISGVVYSASVYAKQSEYSILQISFSSVWNPIRANFNLNNGVLGSVDSGLTAKIEPVGNGWYRCSVSSTSPTTISSGSVVFGIVSAANSARFAAFAGDGTSGIYIWGADLRVANDGVNIPAYQRVNTSTDYDTTGFPMYLRFDGVDDGMVTNSINFTSTDKMTVWAGVRKLAGASTAIVAELSSSTANNGSFGVYAPRFGVGVDTYGAISRGTAPADFQTTYGFSPDTRVLAFTSDISGDSAIVRLNGTQAASSTADQGTGNYGNYPLFIGRRNNASLPFNGRLHSLIVRGAQSTAEQIAAAETYVNSRTKAY